MSGEGGGNVEGLTAGGIAQSAVEQLKTQEKLKQNQREIQEIIGNSLQATQKLLEIENIRLGTLETQLDRLAKGKITLEEIEKKYGNLQNYMDTILEDTKLNQKQQELLNQALAKGNTGYKEAVKLVQEFRGQQKLASEFSEKIADVTSSLASKMGIVADASKTMSGQFIGFVATAAKLKDPAKAFSLMADGALELFNPLNMVANVFDKLIKNAMAFGDAAANLRLATGFSRDFESEMTSLYEISAQYGMTIKESNETYTAMIKNIKGVNVANKDLRDGLAESAIVLNRLGVSSDVTTKNQEFMLKTMKASGPQIANTLQDIAIRADALGVSAEELSAQFAKSMDYLIAFGEEGVEALKDLQIQAAASGVAVDSMIKITQSFDKFADGAKKAATMNAVLGTSLSSMALMTMNPAERMRELRTQINMATGGVENMTTAQRLFTAEAMGYTSVAEMMADLQSDPSKMEERVELQRQEEEIQKKLASAMEKLVPLGVQLSRAFDELASDGGTINAFVGAIKAGIGVLKFFIENWRVILPLLIVAKGYTMIMAAATIYQTRAMQAQTAATLQAIAASNAQIAASATGNAAKSVETAIVQKNTAGWIANGFAQMSASKKAAILATVLAGLMAVFLMTGSPAFWMMPFVIAGAIFLMGKALDTVKGQALLAAVVLALLAGAFALMFYGISAVVDSITGLFEVMINGVSALPTVVGSLIALGFAFVFLGNMATFGAAGILLGLGALTAMLLIFKLTGASFADMFGAGDEILKIGTGMERLGTGLSNLRSSVASLKSSLGGDGLFAGSISSDSSSIVMGKGVAIAKLFKNSKIEVEVKTPEVNMPKITVKVFIGDEELKDIIRKEITRTT